MTTERWTDERLDRLADAVGQTADAVNQLITGIGQLNQRTETISLAVERMTDVQLQTFQVIEEMQAEVRGLQTENRRILDYLWAGIAKFSRNVPADMLMER
jgi:methyl-accepting chemotaxis protein